MTPPPPPFSLSFESSYHSTALLISAGINHSGNRHFVTPSKHHVVLNERFDTHALTGAAGRLAAHTENPADFLLPASRSAMRPLLDCSVPLRYIRHLYYVLHGRRQILDVIQPSILRWRPSSLSEHPWRNRFAGQLCFALGGLQLEVDSRFQIAGFQTLPCSERPYRRSRFRQEHRLAVSWTVLRSPQSFSQVGNRVVGGGCHELFLYYLTFCPFT